MRYELWGAMSPQRDMNMQHITAFRSAHAERVARARTVAVDCGSRYSTVAGFLLACPSEFETPATLLYLALWNRFVHLNLDEPITTCSELDATPAGVGDTQMAGVSNNLPNPRSVDQLT